MKHLNQLPERSFLKLFFFLFSFAFLLAAFFMPDRQDMLPGLLRIIQNPTLASSNFFSIGGYAATFLNMGLLGLICSALYCIPGTTPAGPSVLAVILTVGFGSWGIHVLNVWPTMLGPYHTFVSRTSVICLMPVYYPRSVARLVSCYALFE